MKIKKSLKYLTSRTKYHSRYHLAYSSLTENYPSRTQYVKSKADNGATVLHYASTTYCKSHEKSLREGLLHSCVMLARSQQQVLRTEMNVVYSLQSRLRSEIAIFLPYRFTPTTGSLKPSVKKHNSFTVILWIKNCINTNTLVR